jgi:hypothetical protein
VFAFHCFFQVRHFFIAGLFKVRHHIFKIGGIVPAGLPFVISGTVLLRLRFRAAARRTWGTLRASASLLGAGCSILLPFYLFHGKADFVVFTDT